MQTLQLTDTKTERGCAVQILGYHLRCDVDSVNEMFVRCVLIALGIKLLSRRSRFLTRGEALLLCTLLRHQRATIKHNHRRYT